MIEIVFSDSAGGILRQAQHYGEGKYCGGATCIFISHSDGSKPTKVEMKNARCEFEEKERRSWAKAVPLGGNPKDVASFTLLGASAASQTAAWAKSALPCWKNSLASVPRMLEKLQQKNCIKMP